MNHRLKYIRENNINLEYIQNIIRELDPFEWVVDFLNWAQEKMQVIVLSDTFIEFAWPLIDKMWKPTIFCHNLLTDEEWNITWYKLRLKDQKTEAVKRFKELNFNVIASWDSFNDTWMLWEAHNWFFFKPSPKTVEQFPQYLIAEDYEELKDYITSVLW